MPSHSTRRPSRLVAVAVHSLTTSPSRAYKRRPLNLQVGVPLEDAGDVRADGVPLDAIPGGVVLEDHPGSVERDDRVHVVRVPGVVVALDRPLELVGGVAGIHAGEYRILQGIDVYR